MDDLGTIEKRNDEFSAKIAEENARREAEKRAAQHPSRSEQA